MPLTSAQQGALERLRRQERQWRVQRWLVIAAGLLNLGIGCGMLIEAEGELSALAAGPASGFGVDMAAPAAVLLGWGVAAMFLGAAVVAAAIVRWRGNPARTLLLSLFQEGREGGERVGEVRR